MRYQIHVCGAVSSSYTNLDFLFPSPLLHRVPEQPLFDMAADPSRYWMWRSLLPGLRHWKVLCDKDHVFAYGSLFPLLSLRATDLERQTSKMNPCFPLRPHMVVLNMVIPLEGLTRQLLPYGMVDLTHGVLVTSRSCGQPQLKSSFYPIREICTMPPTPNYQR